jgi:hypothetical protein
MLDRNVERLRAHQANIGRYRRVLATRLSDLERSYIERRLGDEQASVKGLLQTFLDPRGSPRIEGRMSIHEMAAFLHPAGAFAHPMDVVDDCDLTSYEKRAILTSWAADASAASKPRHPLGDSAISFDDILDALQLLEPDAEPADNGKGSDIRRPMVQTSIPSISKKLLRGGNVSNRLSTTSIHQ